MIRQFCSGNSGEKDILSISLAQPVPFIPAPKYVKPSELKHETQVTQLENGLCVASENKFGHFCTVGGISFIFCIKLYFNVNIIFLDVIVEFILNVHCYSYLN